MISVQQGKRLGLNVIFAAQDSSELEVSILVVLAIYRVLAVADEKIGFQRLGTSDRDERRGEVPFTFEKRRRPGKFDLVIVQGLLLHVLNQGVPINDFQTLVAAIKDDQVFGVSQSEKIVVRPEQLSGAGIAAVIDDPQGDLRIGGAILLSSSAMVL